MRSMRRVALLGAAVVGIACGDSNNNVVVPPVDGVVGTFSLISVNGLPTPVLLAQDDTAKLELLRSTLALGGDATFSEIFTLRLTAPSAVQFETDTSAGTYTRAGTTLTFVPNGGGASYQMEVTDANTLTDREPGFVIIYRRN